MRDLDDGGGAGHGHLPVVAGDGFPWRPVNIGYLGPAIFGLYPCNSFRGTFDSIRRTCDSSRVVLQLLGIHCKYNVVSSPGPVILY